MDLASNAQLVTGISRDSNVVGTLQDELDIANLEDLGATLFGVAASCMQHIIDERVGKIEYRLRGNGQLVCRSFTLA